MGLDNYFRFLFALIFVIALIAVLAWLARRYGLGGAAVSGGGRRKRLRLVESLPLDPKRRLVLVRRDEVEHLLLLSASGDLRIETGIAPAAADFHAALAAKPDGDDGASP
ncbi:MAG TPA: flagellar biosynthetic protein FliO [Alphaproteobacteria bacterium]|nr:flagellar biosynthetic protein FliO [Alphaproteobacteria bacterium]